MAEEGDISVLPEGCISKILSLTSPRDACTSSAVSSTFKSASDSDAVWEKFLPDDYRDIAARAAAPLDLRGFASKKELYLRLCDQPLLIDGGNKSFNLEKISGKNCFMVGARELNIVWSDTRQYWTWTSEEQSRFAEVAQLMNVCWLLIEGKIDTGALSPKTTYTVYLVVKFAERTSGFDFQPVDVTVKFVGEGAASGTRLVNLDPELKQDPRMQDPNYRFTRPVNFDPVFEQDPRMQDPNYQFMVILPMIGHADRPVSVSPTRYESQIFRERADGWMEVVMGEFYNEDGDDGDVEVSLAETEGGYWKSGLILQGIEVRPKKFDS